MSGSGHRQVLFNLFILIVNTNNVGEFCFWGEERDGLGGSMASCESTKTLTATKQKLGCSVLQDTYTTD